MSVTFYKLKLRTGKCKIKPNQRFSIIYSLTFKQNKGRAWDLRTGDGIF